MKQAVLAFYATIVYYQASQSLVPGQAAWFPDSSGKYPVPIVSDSPPWVPGATLEMDSLLPDLVDDLNGTFGRVRVVSMEVRFLIRMESVMGEDVLSVEETQVWGELQDLYDFNHDVVGVARNAAIMQIGHGNGLQGTARANGVIYRTKIFIHKTTTGLP